MDIARYKDIERRYKAITKRIKEERPKMFERMQIIWEEGRIVQTNRFGDFMFSIGRETRSGPHLTLEYLERYLNDLEASFE